jgi:hypothetical protein
VSILGKEEGQHLEFKARDALRKPAGIARGVVAMLNAGGGDVWIGVREDGGRAVELQPIPEPERESDKLWNHLLDTIEPPPSGEEIQLEVVPVEQGSILRVAVTPSSSKGPYAQLKDGGRHFVVRSRARTRPMTREEVFMVASDRTRSDSSPRRPFERLTRARERILASKDPTFWVRLDPDRELDIDVQSKEIERYLRAPELSGNRETGWTFANSYVSLRVERDRRVLGDEKSGRTAIERSGAVEHTTPLPWLTHDSHPAKEIYPLALLEKTVSVFRLASALYRDREVTPRDDFRVAADLSIVSAKGWRLRAYSPSSNAWAYGHHDVKGFEHLTGELKDELVFERPLVFTRQQLEAKADECALRLLVRVYEAFGLTEDMIPVEFDRKRGILALPQ